MEIHNFAIMKFETYDVLVKSLWLIQGDKSYGMLNKINSIHKQVSPKKNLIDAIWVQFEPKTYIDSHKTSLQLALMKEVLFF